jgi:ankyrin repeat protein
MGEQPPEPVVPEPVAYTEGFMREDYERVAWSLREDPSQAILSFGERRTTLLHAACYDGRVDLAESLIGLGADIHAREVDGTTPLHRAAANAQLDVITLLLRHGADPNAQAESGVTPIMLAKVSRTSDSREAVELLRRHGARGPEVFGA